MRNQIRAAGAATAVLLAALLLDVTSGEAATMVLDRCTDVPPGTTAVLEADLTCGGHCSLSPEIACDATGGNEQCPGLDNSCEPDVVRLGRGSRLLMRGFTLNPVLYGKAIECGVPGDRGVCTVVGPGRIAGQKGIAVQGNTMDVVVRDLKIDRSNAAILTEGKIRATGLEIESDRENDLSAGGVVTVTRSRILGYGGVRSRRNVRLRDVEIGYGDVNATGTVRGVDVLIHHDSAIRGHDVHLRRATNVVPGVGPRDGWVVAERKLVLMDSVLIDNDEREGRPDIISGQRPRLVRTVCGRSAHLDDLALSWNVCSND
jgi:hypothetical protein